MSDLYIGPEDQQAITDSVNSAGHLPVPTVEDNPTFIPVKDPTAGGAIKADLGRWTETLAVRDSSMAPPKKNPDANAVVFQVKFDVLGTEDGGCDFNKGKTWTYVEYIDKDILFDKNHKLNNMIQRKVGKLNSLLGALGVDTSKGVNYEEYFNGEKPMIGSVVYGTLSRYRYRSKLGEVKTEFEPSVFLPLDGATAVA